MIVSLFFFSICFDPSASRASTRRSRSASEVVWSSVSVVAVALMSDRLPDHVPEAAVVEDIGLEQLVAADLGPARDVGTGAGVGREELEEVARTGVFERPSEGDERPRARLTLGIDGARDDIHGCGTSKTLRGTRWARAEALSRCQQGQAQMRSGIMAATVPISRVLIIAGATSYSRTIVRGNGGRGGLGDRHRLHRATGGIDQGHKPLPVAEPAAGPVPD